MPCFCLSTVRISIWKKAKGRAKVYPGAGGETNSPSEIEKPLKIWAILEQTIYGRVRIQPISFWEKHLLFGSGSEQLRNRIFIHNREDWFYK